MLLSFTTERIYGLRQDCGLSQGYLPKFYLILTLVNGIQANKEIDDPDMVVSLTLWTAPGRVRVDDPSRDVGGDLWRPNIFKLVTSITVSSTTNCEYSGNVRYWIHVFEY